jgi:hypothetical protein
MLTAFIKHGHNNCNAVSLTADSSNDSLEVLIVIVRTHGNFLSEHFILHTVVEAVGNDINVAAAHCCVKKSLCLTGTESGTLSVDNEGLVIIVASPLLKIILYLIYELVATLHSDNAKLTV